MNNLLDGIRQRNNHLGEIHQKTILSKDINSKNMLLSDGIHQKKNNF